MKRKSSEALRTLAAFCAMPVQAMGHAACRTEYGMPVEAFVGPAARQ